MENILKNLTKNMPRRLQNTPGEIEARKRFRAIQRQYSRPIVRQTLTQDERSKVAEKRKFPTRNYSQKQRQAAAGAASAVAATPFVQRMGNLIAKGVSKAGPSVVATTVAKIMEPKPAGQGSALYGPGSDKKKRNR